MLKLLNQYIRLLPNLLESASNWNSLYIDYETPHVYRLWRQMDEDHRLMLHKIMPCEKPYVHTHPWPSAIKILEGAYEMGLGAHGCGTWTCDGICDTYTAATMILTSGVQYEMIEPYAWHYVKPLNQTPSYSIMVIGKPWAHPHGKSDKKPANPLDAETCEALLYKFKSLLNQGSV